MSEYKKDPEQVGAAWLKAGTKGPWLSLQIKIDGQDHSFVAFKNGYKKKNTHPDWIIKRSRSQQPESEPQPDDDECPF